MASVKLQYSSRGIGVRFTSPSFQSRSFATSCLCIPFQKPDGSLRNLEGVSLSLSAKKGCQQFTLFKKSRNEAIDLSKVRCKRDATAEELVDPSPAKELGFEQKSNESESITHLLRYVASVLILICFFSEKAHAADVKRRNKLKEERLAWEKSQRKGPQNEKGLLGGLLSVSEQSEGPVKVDVNLGRGAKYARRKLYKALYFSEEAIEEFRDKMRRSKSVVERRPNFFQRNREMTSAIQLCLCLGLLVVAGRWFLRLVKQTAWVWSGFWLKRKAKSGTRVRDRSLGGKEVAVGNQWDWLNWGSRGGEKKSRRQTLGGVRSKTEVVKHANPLDYEVDLRSEKDVLRARLRQEERKAAIERRREMENLPDWWPRESLLPRVKVSDSRKEVGRFEAQQLLQKLVNMRVVGQDPSLADIEELHETCQLYAVSVTFDVASTQESIYRGAVQHKLAQLMSAVRYERIEPRLRLSTARFIGLLSGDLSIQPRRAVDLVESIVAAKTKASFIQAYALLKQQRTKDLQQELAGLALILSVFPLPLDSAKLELVGDGLSARFSSADRKELLDSICDVARSKGISEPAESAEDSAPRVEDIAARALDLMAR